jgi:hypothetical protein
VGGRGIVAIRAFSLSPCRSRAVARSAPFRVSESARSGAPRASRCRQSGTACTAACGCGLSSSRGRYPMRGDGSVTSGVPCSQEPVATTRPGHVSTCNHAMDLAGSQPSRGRSRQPIGPFLCLFFPTACRYVLSCITTGNPVLAHGSCSADWGGGLHHVFEGSSPFDFVSKSSSIFPTDGRPAGGSPYDGLSSARPRRPFFRVLVRVRHPPETCWACPLPSRLRRLSPTLLCRQFKGCGPNTRTCLPHRFLN